MNAEVHLTCVWSKRKTSLDFGQHIEIPFVPYSGMVIQAPGDVPNRLTIDDCVWDIPTAILHIFCEDMKMDGPVEEGIDFVVEDMGFKLQSWSFLTPKQEQKYKELKMRKKMELI